MNILAFRSNEGGGSSTLAGRRCSSTDRGASCRVRGWYDLAIIPGFRPRRRRLRSGGIVTLFPEGTQQPRRQARSPQVGHRRPGITGRRRFGSIYQLGPSQSKMHPPTVRHTGISPLTQLPHYRAGNRLKIRDPSIFQSLLRWSRSHFFTGRMISVGTPGASPSRRIRGRVPSP